MPAAPFASCTGANGRKLRSKRRRSIVGCGNIAEIWAAEKWEEINSEDNLASVAELMDEYGL